MGRFGFLCACADIDDDINLSCEQHFCLHFYWHNCKDTQKTCNQYISNSYQDVCVNQDQDQDQCKIRYYELPALKDCQYGIAPNFSMVDYLRIPDDGITEDLPRTDICSTGISEPITIDRGFITFA
ncbi:unnamed protein product [Rotaria socialis]|uniref:Uncharacterized protein n=1 Tax=Rotaria socialis TaxID=392032 RepID=A0A821CK99_9BILA|nr:unnamed protein product [Rotaria socialis]CAF4608844.1 unnamed protein product [Rotaria socialis]